MLVFYFALGYSKESERYKNKNTNQKNVTHRYTISTTTE